MSSVGPKYPGSVATAQETGDDNDWTTASNVGADDGSYAQITAATFDTGDVSYVLRATNFSMGVPTGATINGIVVEIERHYANGQVVDVDVCLTANGTTRVGDDKSTGANFPATDQITTFGSSTDTWNAGLTVAQVNGTTFGVIYKMGASAENADGFLDFIRVTIYYTAVTTYSLDCSEGLKTGESLGTQALFGIPITDGLKGGESLVPQASMNMAISDGMKGGEYLTPQVLFRISITDGAKGGEGLSHQANLPSLVLDGLALGETPTLLSILQMLLNEGVKGGEIVAINLGLQYYTMLTGRIKFGDEVDFALVRDKTKRKSHRIGDQYLERSIWKIRSRRGR